MNGLSREVVIDCTIVFESVICQICEYNENDSGESKRTGERGEYNR